MTFAGRILIAIDRMRLFHKRAPDKGSSDMKRWLLIGFIAWMLVGTVLTIAFGPSDRSDYMTDTNPQTLTKEVWNK